jgi:hypothetical protein
MPDKRAVLLVALVLAISSLSVVSLAAVSTNVGGDQSLVVKTGTVRYIGIEGGFFGIASDDGNHYDPINLGSQYKVDGLRIVFMARILSGMASVHMWGIIIEIAWVSRL